MATVENAQADQSNTKVEPSSSSGNALPVPADNSTGISEASIDAQQATAQLMTAESVDLASGTFSTLSATAVAQTAPQQMQSVPTESVQTPKSTTLDTSTETAQVRVDASGNKVVSQPREVQAFTTISDTRASQQAIKTDLRKETGTGQVPAKVAAPSSSTTNNQGVTPKITSEPTMEQPTTVTSKTAEAEFAPANLADETRGPRVEVVSQLEVETQSLNSAARTIANTALPEQSESVTLPAEAQTGQGDSAARTIGTVKQATTSRNETDPAMVSGKTMDNSHSPQPVNLKPPQTVDQTTEMHVVSQEPLPAPQSSAQRPDVLIAATQDDENGSSTATLADEADVPESEPATSTTAFKFEEASTSSVHHPAAPVNDVQPPSDETRTDSSEHPSTPSFGVGQPSSEFAAVEKATPVNTSPMSDTSKADIQGTLNVFKSAETDIASTDSMASKHFAENGMNVEAKAEVETGETKISGNGIVSKSEQLKTDTALVSNETSSPEPAQIFQGARLPAETYPEAETGTRQAEVSQPNQDLHFAGKPDSGQPIQVTEPASSGRQAVTEPVQSEKASPDAVVSNVTLPSVQPGEKPHPDHEASEKTPRTDVQDATTSAGSSVDQVLPLASNTVHAEEPKETLKTKQAVKEETVEPVEKQPKMYQMSGTAAHANNPVTEPVAAEQSRDIPVGQINAQAAEVAQQVIRHLRSNINSGSTSMHLQLNPKELGAIDVQMVSSSEGLHVTFFAEQVQTGKLLESQLPQLRESLVDSGVQLSGLNISQHNHSGQKGETFGQNTNFAQTSQRDLPQDKANNQEASPAERRTGKSSEVDYLI